MLNIFNEHVEAEIELHDALAKSGILLTREVVHARSGMEVHYVLTSRNHDFASTNIIRVYDYMRALPLDQLMNNCTYNLWKRCDYNFYKLVGDFIHVQLLMEERAQRKKL